MSEDVYGLLATLLDAANAHADTLSLLVQDTEGEPEAQADYRDQLAELESAITAARELLRSRALSDGLIG